MKPFRIRQRVKFRHGRGMGEGRVVAYDGEEFVVVEALRKHTTYVAGRGGVAGTPWTIRKRVELLEAA